MNVRFSAIKSSLGRMQVVISDHKVTKDTSRCRGHISGGRLAAVRHLATGTINSRRTAWLTTRRISAATDIIRSNKSNHLYFRQYWSRIEQIITVAQTYKVSEKFIFLYQISQL